MKRHCIAATQRECPDRLGIHRLPANRYLRLLCIIPAMPRRHGWEKPRRQHRGGVGAIPFFSFGKVYFEAVEAREVPCRTGEWHTYFLVDPPDVPIHTVALPVRRADGIKRSIERVTIASESRRIVLAANGKGDRPGGKIEQVTVKSGIVYRQLILT